jgi:SCY1-like protein 1
MSARTSTSSNANDYFQDSNAPDEEIEIDDAWGEMDEDGDSFFDAPNQSKAPKPAPSATNPFDDNGEPDFEGWLAAQAGKKHVGKPLPKGLAKSANANGRPAVAGRSATTGSVGAGAGAKKAAATTVPAVKAKPVVAKKIDTAPKETGDDDGWGDGW